NGRWSPTRSISKKFEHDPEKACPGLDPGWTPVFRQDHAPLKLADFFAALAPFLLAALTSRRLGPRWLFGIGGRLRRRIGRFRCNRFGFGVRLGHSSFRLRRSVQYVACFARQLRLANVASQRFVASKLGFAGLPCRLLLARQPLSFACDTFGFARRL